MTQPTAIFIGWMPPYADLSPLPLFNVPVPGGMTTVSERRARERGFAIPDFPAYEEWEKTTQEKDLK